MTQHIFLNRCIGNRVEVFYDKYETEACWWVIKTDPESGGLLEG